MPKYQQDKRNANRGTTRGRDALKQSLERLGAGRSVLVDKHGVTIAGNKTLEAATELGLTKTIEVETDGSTLVVVKRIDMDLDKDVRAREMAFADNRVAELDLEWDAEVLQADLEMLKSDFLDELWTPEDLGALFENEPESQEVTEDEPPIDKASELQAKWQVSPGDLWVIGEHRLICGDCTDKATVDRLMGGEKAVLVFTDPPYGIKRDKGFGGADGFNGSGNPIHRRQYSDDWDNERPSKDTFNLILSITEMAIIFGGNFFADILPQGKHWIVWDKKNTMPTFGDCELAWTNVKRTSVKMYTIIYNGLIGKELERYHPTQKPVKLFCEILSDYSSKNQLVYDPFLGSGTTMVAAHQTGRRCYGLEIAPGYCAVILERMSKLGLTPVKSD